jgi:hypothetical protein
MLLKLLYIPLSIYLWVSRPGIVLNMLQRPGYLTCTATNHCRSASRTAHLEAAIAVLSRSAHQGAASLKPSRMDVIGGLIRSCALPLAARQNGRDHPVGMGAVCQEARTNPFSVFLFNPIERKKTNYESPSALHHPMAKFRTLSLSVGFEESMSLLQKFVARLAGSRGGWLLFAPCLARCCHTSGRGLRCGCRAAAQGPSLARQLCGSFREQGGCFPRLALALSKL